MKNQMDESEEVNVIYNQGDFRALYRACRRCKRNAALMMLLLPILFIVLSYIGGQRSAELLFYDTVPSVIIAVISILAFYFFWPWYAVRVRRKNGWGEPIAVRFTDEGISTRHPNQESVFYWSKIRDVVVRGQRIFLFTTPSCAIILPRKCFLTEQQFVDWANRAKALWASAKSVTVE